MRAQLRDLDALKMLRIAQPKAVAQLDARGGDIRRADARAQTRDPDAFDVVRIAQRAAVA